MKMATGAGKTTSMAMLIAWQVMNAVRSPTSKLFTRGFLIVAPGITIKDRLRVLQPNEANSYYKSNELVPADMLDEINKAKIVITNYHAFQLREVMKTNKVVSHCYRGAVKAENSGDSGLMKVIWSAKATPEYGCSYYRCVQKNFANTLAAHIADLPQSPRSAIQAANFAESSRLTVVTIPAWWRWPVWPVKPGKCTSRCWRDRPARATHPPLRLKLWMPICARLMQARRYRLRKKRRSLSAFH